MKLFISVIFLGFLSLGFLASEEINASLNGVVCNYSSGSIWLTVTESGHQKASPLAAGDCTDGFRQDAEAIWGRECSGADACTYQAWKLSVGRFEVYDDGRSPAGAVLRIKGWGLGSRWHITREWPKPELNTLDYSLVR